MKPYVDEHMFPEMLYDLATELYVDKMKLLGGVSQ